MKPEQKVAFAEVIMLNDRIWKLAQELEVLEKRYTKVLKEYRDKYDTVAP